MIVVRGGGGTGWYVVVVVRGGGGARGRTCTLPLLGRNHSLWVVGRSELEAAFRRDRQHAVQPSFSLDWGVEFGNNHRTPARE